MIPQEKDDSAVQTPASSHPEFAKVSQSTALLVSLPRTLLRSVVWFFVLLLGTMGLSALALQTQSGQNLLTNHLEKLLHHPDYGMALTRLHGQFPTDLYLDHLALMDQEGVWLELRKLHIAWSLTELFWGKIHIDEISAETVQLHRKPITAPTERGKVSSSTSAETISLPTYLPPLRLDRLFVSNIILDKRITGKEARFSLTGQIVLDSDGQPGRDRDKLRAKLEIRPQDTALTYLTLDGSLFPRSQVDGPLDLALTIEGRENSGLTASLTGLSQAKSMAFHLAGKGPLNTWQGELAATVEGLGHIRSQLATLPLASEDSIPIPTLQLQGTLVAETGVLPAQLATLFTNPHAEPKPPSLDFALQAALPDHQHIHLRHLDLTTPFASVHAQGVAEMPSNTLTLQVKLEIPHLESLPILPDNPPSGHAIVSLQADGPWLRPHWKLTARIVEPKAAEWQAKQLLGTFDGAFSADLDQPVTTLHIQGQGEVLDLYRTADPSRFQETLAWSTDLNITPSGKVHIAKLEIHDPAITVGLQGSIDIAQGEALGDFRGTLDHFSHLEKLAALGGTAVSLSGAEGTGLITGNFHWSTAPPTLKTQEPIRLNLTGTFSALQGLPATVQALVGESLDAQMDVSIWPGEKLTLKDIDIRGKGLQASGDLQANLVSGTLTSTVQTTLPTLELLTPEAGMTMAGKLVMDTVLSGTFNKPKLQVTLHSNALKLQHRSFKNFRAVLAAHTLDSMPQGTVTAHFEDHGAEIDTALTYRLENPWLTVSDLNLQLPGTTLTAKSLKIHSTLGVVDGQLRGRSETLTPLMDWLDQAPTKAVDPSIDSVAVAADSMLPLVPPRLKGGNPANSALSGTVEIVVELTSEGKRQNMTSDLQAQLIRGPSLFLESARMSATSRDLFGEAQGRADIVLGQLDWNTTKLRNGKLTAVGNRQSVQINLQAKGQAQKPFELDIEGRVGMDAKGVVHGTLAGLTGTIDQDVLLLEQEGRITWTPSQSQDRTGGSLNLEPLTVRYGPARMHGHAYYDAKRVEIDLELGLPLSTTARFWGPDLLGTAKFEAKFRGAPNNPQGQLDLRLDQVRPRDPQLEAIPATDIVAHGVLDNGQTSTRITLSNLSPTPMVIQVSAPMQVAFSPFHFKIPPRGKLEGKADADIRIEPFSDLFALDAQKLEGLLKVALQLHGTVAAPKLQGTVLLSDGRYENNNSGTILEDIRFTMVANGQNLIIEKLEAKDEERGRLHGVGRLLVDGEQHFPFQGEITFDKMLLVQRDDLHSVMSGIVGVRGDSQRFKVSGELTSEELLLYFSDSLGQEVESVTVDTEIRNGLDITTKEEPVSAGSQIDLDVVLHLANRVFARGRGLESEWFGDFTLQGSVDEPLVLGQLRMRRGYFEFLDKRFELRKGIISLDGASPPQPNIDLEAESQANEMLALLILRGPAFSPKLTLSSEPTMPKDEILSRLLFNRNSQQLSPAQALGLLSAIKQLRGGGGPSLLGKARDSFGIDRLELEGDGLESSSVKAGKYLNDNIFVGVEHGLNQDGGKVSVEWELTPSITVETEVEEHNNSSVGINWKYDY